MATHASGHGFLAKDQISQIKRSWFLEHSHYNQPATRPCKSPCKLCCTRLSGTFNHHVKSLSFGEIERAPLRILLRRINNICGAKLFRGLFTPLSNFHRNHSFRPTKSSGKQCHQPYWPCSHNRHIVIWSDFSLLNGTHRRGKGLNQGTHFV